MHTTRTYRIVGTTAVAIAALGVAAPAQADQQPWTVTKPQPVEAPAASPTTPAPATPAPAVRGNAWTTTAPTRPAEIPAAAGLAVALAPQADQPTDTPRPAQARTSAHHPRHTVQRVARRAAHAQTQRTPRVAAGAHATGTWYVAPGETLSYIARATGTTVHGLLTANRHAHPSITRDYVRAGWALHLPAGTR